MPKELLNIDTLDNIKGSKKLTRYDGGLNTTDSNEILEDNEAIVKENWGNDETGAITKVTGFTVRNNAALALAAVRGLFRVYQSDGTRKLLAVCNTKLYYSDDTGVTFSQATSGTGLSASDYNSGVNHNDLYFFSNETDNIQTFTPSTNTMAAATDQPTDACRIILKRADRRLLALVNGTNGSTLYYSKIDPTGAAADDWSASNDAGSIAIDGAKSEALTGGMTFGAVDIIFKDYAAFQVWGYPAPAAIRMPGSPGCAAPQSVSQGDGYGFFLSHDAIWMYDGTKFIKISAKIQSLIDDIAPAYKKNAFGVYRNGLYWFFYTETGETLNKKCIIYDVDNSNPYIGKNIWYERPGIEANCPIVLSGPADANELYAGSSGAIGYIYRLDYSSDGSDGGATIRAVHQTKYFNMGFPHLVKRFSKIYVTYFSSTGEITINWYTKRGSVSGSFTIPVSQTGTALGTFVLGTDSLASTVEATHKEPLPDTAIGEDISIEIIHNNIGTSPIIRDIKIDWEALYVE